MDRLVDQVCNEVLMSFKFFILFLFIMASCTSRKLKPSSSEPANEVNQNLVNGPKPDLTKEIKAKIIERNRGVVSGLGSEAQLACSYIIKDSDDLSVETKYLEITFPSGQVVNQDLSQRSLKDEGNRIVFLEPNAKLGLGLRVELEYLDDGFITAIRWLKDKDLKGECEFREGSVPEVSDLPLTSGRHWEEVFGEEAGFDGFYCKHKPEGQLCGGESCKEWLKIDTLGTLPAVGYICAYDPGQMVLPQDKPDIACQIWAPFKNSLLGVDGYFCKTIQADPH
jgi:hypothetical protein